MIKASLRRHGHWVVFAIVALLAGGIDSLGLFPAIHGTQSGAGTGAASGTAEGFTISGRVDTPLAPTSTAPIDLVLTNSGDVPLTITGLTVQVADIIAKNGDGVNCDPRHFAIRPFSGGYGFTLAAATTSSLAELGFQPARWPQVTMLDLPTNQDGCKNVMIRFRVTGTGLESAS